MPEPLPRGLGADEGADRFATYWHVLRELVHGENGWLPLEASFARKYALGDFMHDDARSLARVRRRLYELRHPDDDPGAPGPGLVAMLDRIAAARDARAWVDVAYGEVKPALEDAVRRHIELLDPITDEPSLRLLERLAERQARHIADWGVPLR